MTRVSLALLMPVSYSHILQPELHSIALRFHTIIFAWSLYLMFAMPYGYSPNLPTNMRGLNITVLVVIHRYDFLLSKDG